MKRTGAQKRVFSLLLASWMLFSFLFTDVRSVQAAGFGDGTPEESMPEECVNAKNESGAENEEQDVETNEEETEKVPVEGLRLSRTSLNLETGKTAELYLSIFPEDADYSEILWESDDTDVVTVAGDGTKATVTASDVNEGFAVVTATVGDCSVTCDVIVSKSAPMLESLRFTAYSNSAEDVYDLSDMDAEKKEYELIVPVTASSVYIWPGLKDGLEDVTITADYIDRTGDAMHKELSTTGGYTQLSFLLAKGSLTPTEIKITIRAEEKEEIYTVKVFRGTSLKKVEFQSESGSALKYTPDFDAETKYYTLYVPEGSGALHVAMTPTDSGTTKYYVNGQETGQEATVDSLEGLSQISVGGATGENTKPRTYVFQIKTLPASRITFQVKPEDALVAVYDSQKNRIFPDEQGVYVLEQGAEYTYTVSKVGYVSASGSIDTSADGEIPVSLKKISGSGDTVDLDAEWSGVYKNDKNQNILEAEPATDEKEAELSWRNHYENLSGITLVDGMLCAYSESELMLIDPETGETIKKAQLGARGQTGLGNKPVYGGGKIFVQLTTGRIQAFDAFSLKSLWLYANPDGGMLTGGLRYDNGYLYAGTYNSSTGTEQLLCISTEDEDPTNTMEEKECLWKHKTSGGYYCTSPYTDETYIYAVSSTGKLLCMEKTTGLLKQSIDLAGMGGTAAAIAYYEGRIYFTTVNGYLCSYRVGENGVEEESLQSYKLGGCSKSTPVIYNGRLYVGYSTGAASAGQPAGAGPYYLAVLSVDASTGKTEPIYQTQLMGMVNESTTVAVSKDGKEVRICFTVNHGTYGGVYVLWDAAGQAEASEKNTYLKISDEGTDMATGSVVMGQDGTMYLRTENGSLMAVNKTDLLITGVSVDDPEAEIDGGSFYSYVKEHEIILSRGTLSTTFTVETGEGVDVSLNGEQTKSIAVDLVNGEADVMAVISKDGVSKTYTFHFTEAVDRAALRTLFLSTGTHFDSESNVQRYDPLEDLSAETDNYTIYYRDRASTWYFWATPETGGSSSIEVKPISGCTETKKLQAIAFNNNTYYYKFSMAFNSDAAEIEVTVTAPDGVTKKTYMVTILKDTTAPTIHAASVPLTNRLANSVDLSFTASEKGNLYYILYDSIPTTLPTVTMYKQTGTKAAQKVQQGMNTITLTGLSKKNQYLCALMVDGAGNWAPYISPIQLNTGAAPEIPLTGVEIDKETLTMEIGGQEEVSLNLLPFENSDEPEITWTTDNRKVATVSGTGTSATINAVGGGSANIMAKVTVGEKVYFVTCKVAVKIGVTDIRLNTYELELKVGDTADLTAVLMPLDIQETPKILWRNSNKNYITLSADGTKATVTAVEAGTAVVQILAGSVQAECRIKVVSDTPPEPEPEKPTGDVNQDGSVDIFDVALTIDMIRGLEEPDLGLADMDENGYLDIFDAVTIVDILRKSES